VSWGGTSECMFDCQESEKEGSWRVHLNSVYIIILERGMMHKAVYN